MSISLIFNTINQNTQAKYTQLLHLISIHPSFQSKYNPTMDNIVKLGTLYFTLLIPQFPLKYSRLLAQQLFQNIKTHDNRVTYNNLKDYLLKLCSYAIENIDVKSAIGFLQLLKSRITDTYIINVNNPADKKKINISIKLQILQSQTILTESQIPEKYHRQEVKNIYFQQKVALTQEQISSIKQTEILVTQLKSKVEDVIPLGYICQDFIFKYTNGNFQIKSGYRLRNNKKININKVDYWVGSNEMSNNFIRDFLVNQQIFNCIPVITGNYIPSQVTPQCTKVLGIARFNQTFKRRNYLQKLKELTSNQQKYFNLLSEFFQRDQFNIDELTLTRQTLIVKRKENLLGIAGKQPIKKQEKDFNQEVANFGLNISKNLVKFHDDTRFQAVLKELQTILRVAQQQDKIINNVIQKNLSADNHIIRDNKNPFMQDILQYAKVVPLQLLVIGRPKSGKTTLAKAIAKQYNLIYISVESSIQKVIERSKFFEENPPETDQDGNVKDGLSHIQKYILSQLQKGAAIQQEDILDLINNQFQKQLLRSRGFILDLPFEYNKYWIQNLISNRIYLPKIECLYFTHILCTDQTQQQWKTFINSLMQKPQDQSISSSLQRYILRKVKPPPQQGQQQQPQQQGQKPQPLIQSNLLQVKWKQSYFSLIEHLTQHIHPHRFIKVQNSFQSVAECLLNIENSLYKIPLPKKIEGGEKELLSVGLDELKIFRKWSPWGLVDCVQLTRNKLINGKAEFASEYAGRVFLFQNQNNLNAFINNPRIYLQTLPQLPKTTNFAIIGPRKSGKKTIANLLSQIYGLKIINIQQILQSVLARQRQFQTHIPSNFDKRSASVHLSQGQFKQFNKGGLLNAKDILPIILYNIGVNLQKKPVGWGIQKTDDGGAGQNQQSQQKKPAPKKAKKKDKNAQDQRPKTPPPQDFLLKDLIPQINHFGKLNQIRGYIIIGYPNNQQQLNSLKQFNIPIDKLIILSDNSEEAPNKNLQKRLNDAELQQVALFSAGIGPVKQALGEQVCKEILIDKEPAQLINRIRQIVDPFYLKTDQDGINRVLADKQEDGDPIPVGFCGQYCPVSLKNGYLIKGKEQFQAGVQGRRYKFCGQKQLNAFKQQPQKYLQERSPVIPPRILFMGLRGVGLKTQLLKLNEKYRIPILTLKETLLQQLQNQKNKRKTQRYYSKGFKKPEFDQQGKQIQDAQLLQQAVDFDRKNNQIQVLKNIFNGINQIFINSNFFDVEEDKVSTNIVELLGEAKRLPQLVVMLTSDQSKWLERVLNKKQIQRQLDAIKQKRRLQKQKERQQARQKAIQAGQQYNQPPTGDQQDPQIPKLQDLITQKQQSLKAQRQSDSSKLQQYTQAFKSWGVEVLTVKCQRQIKHVTDRINYLIKPYLDDRINRWQKNSMMIIDRTRVKDFLNNYIVRESRFGKINPYTLIQYPKSYPLIYNERIYYLKDQQQRQYVMRNPKTLEQNQAIPKDIKFTPIVFIIGKTKTGKSTLAQNFKDKYGLKILNLQQIIHEFTKQHQDSDIRSILNNIKSGKVLSDQQIIILIQKRVALHDCSKGWVLDGLPLNKKQCQLLNRRGIIPTLVLSIRMSQLQIKKRVISLASTSYKNIYDYDLQIVHNRLQQTRNNLTQIQIYYLNKYNNVKNLDGNLSKWGIFQQSKLQLQKRIKSKRLFIKDLISHAAIDISHINLSYNLIINNLSEFLNYCPISYKIRRQYIKLCLRNYQHLAMYNKKIYVFKGQKQLKDFINNPDTFTNKGNAFSPPEQIYIEDIHIVSNSYQNKGYSIIQLSKKNLIKGNYLFGLSYKSKKYMFSCAKNLKLFQKNPALYQMVKLPDKLPVQFDKKSDLKKIAKRNDCSAFLQHHLSNIMMRCLAQLGYRRPKYPTLGSKESALKFLSISLKATNPNKDDEYRQKYNQKLNKFIKECSFYQQIREELDRKAKDKWQAHDQQNLLKLCQDLSQFMKELQSTDKVQYFSNFIR